MMRKAFPAIAMLTAFLLITSCGDDGGGSRGPNIPPETEIVSGPDFGSTQTYAATIVWKGTDPDGRVDEFDIAWHRGVISCTDLDSVLDWQRTTYRESTFATLADTCPEQGICRGTNTFCVRAVDNDGGIDPDPAFVSFTSTTVLPRTEIIYPERDEGQLWIDLPGCLTFRWEGIDEDGEVVEYRYSAKSYYAWPEGEPPAQDNPSMWSDWTTDTEATIYLSTGGSPWSIYVQSKDNAGAVETFFGTTKNHMVVNVQEDDNVPFVEVCAFRGPCYGDLTLLDCSSTDDPLSSAINVSVGDTLCFESTFQPGPYAEEVTHIAYMVNDTGIPGAWKDAGVNSNRFYPPSGEVYTAPFGVTTIYVWVRDDYCEFGSTNTAVIIISAN
jgi:hypothetical protein